MSWLDNPVANMYGPQFLLLYAAVITAALSALWFLLHRADPTVGEPPPPIPTEPDPYAIAYLRGGIDEVARVAVFELLQRRYLKEKKGVLKKSSRAPDLRHLQEVPRTAYHWLIERGKLSYREIFDSAGLAAGIRDQVEPALVRCLESERLVAAGAVKSFRWCLTAAAAGLIGGLGGYKWGVALAKGHTNVLFLIVMLFGALVGAVMISVKAPSMTARGRRYLDDLYLAFHQLRDRVGSKNRGGPHLPLLVGLFGIGSLAGTSYASYVSKLEPYRQRAWDWSRVSGGSCSDCGSSCGGDCGSSCGGDCGSSCGGDCGSSCGGGCGGCGGCGD